MVERHDRVVTLAWYVNALERRKKLPSLTSLLQKAAKPQTVKQHITAVSMLSMSFGRLRTVKGKVKRLNGQ